MERVPPAPADPVRVQTRHSESTIPHQPPIAPPNSPAKATNPAVTNRTVTHPAVTNRPATTSAVTNRPVTTSAVTNRPATNRAAINPPVGEPRSRPAGPRHRIGASVAELIGSAVVTADAVRGRAPVGGAHRDPPRTGRHRAVPIDRSVDRLAWRRTIGGRPDRGVGRTAL